MKITIDTKEDTPEDIRKVIQLLKSLLQDYVSNSQKNFDSQNYSNSVFDNPGESTGAFNAVFGGDNKVRKEVDDNKDYEETSKNHQIEFY